MALLQESKVLYEQDTQIKAIFSGGVRVWPTTVPTGPDYSEPFYVENITNANETLSIKKSASNAPNVTLEYSTDKITWSTLGTTSTTQLNYLLSPGDKLYLRSNTPAWTTGHVGARNVIYGTSKVGGNIMSLCYGNNFTGSEKTFPDNSKYNFGFLFLENINIIDASKLLLPATTLTNGCYEGLLQTCVNLKYANFELPAKHIPKDGYRAMFYKDYLLTDAPDLPGESLTSECYRMLFYQCRNLQNVKCLATSGINTTNCSQWLDGVPSGGTFVKAAGVTWPTGTSGIPSGWTVQEA